MQILLRNVNVSGSDASLQMFPEIFQPVDVRIVQDIFARSMIHRLVRELFFFVQSFVRAQLVCVNRRALLNICLNGCKGFLADIRDNLCHHLAVALQHSKHNRLLLCSSGDLSLCPSADISFVALNLGRRQRKFAVHFRHVLTDLVSNAKRALVGHAKLPLQLFTRNAMPGSGEQIHRVEPKLQGCPTVFKQCADSRVKMMSAKLARIGAFCLDACHWFSLLHFGQG